jgi:hypothetical protein
MLRLFAILRIATAQLPCKKYSVVVEFPVNAAYSRAQAAQYGLTIWHAVCIVTV